MRAGQYFRQRLGLVIQRGNVISVLGTMARGECLLSELDADAVSGAALGMGLSVEITVLWRVWGHRTCIMQLFYFPVNVSLRFTKIFNISFDPICLTSMMLKTKIVSSSATRALLLMHYIYSEREILLL